MVPTHDTYLDNGALAGLTVGILIGFLTKIKKPNLNLVSGFSTVIPYSSQTDIIEESLFHHFSRMGVKFNHTGQSLPVYPR